MEKGKCLCILQYKLYKRFHFQNRVHGINTIFAHMFAKSNMKMHYFILDNAIFVTTYLKPSAFCWRKATKPQNGKDFRQIATRILSYWYYIVVTYFDIPNLCDKAPGIIWYFHLLFVMALAGYYNSRFWYNESIS